MQTDPHTLGKMAAQTGLPGLSFKPRPQATRVADVPMKPKTRVSMTKAPRLDMNPRQPRPGAGSVPTAPGAGGSPSPSPAAGPAMPPPPEVKPSQSVMGVSG